MEKLSIEEKAKAYDEVVNKLKGFMAQGVDPLITRADVQDFFPELKESEDERIREELKFHFKQLKQQNFVAFTKDGPDVDAILAWLEKQGEHANFRNKIQIGDKVTRNEGGVLVNISQLNRVAKERKKQGGEQILANSAKTCKDEQKPNPYSGTSFDYDGHTWGMCARDNGVDMLYDKHIIGHFENQGEMKILDLFKPAIEATKEEEVDNANKVEPKDYNDIDPHFGKPIDKVVPKFKVGDWVIFNEHHNSVYQVEKIQDFRYYLRHYTGGSMSVHIDNQLIRHWTIQDAKDGDVLSDVTTIFIFKDLLSDGSVMSYCDYDTDSGESDAFCPLSVNLMCSKITPATKEQREQLEKAIADAGYVWFSGKKELKKIEQKPAENEELTEFDKAVGVSIGTWNPKSPEQIQSVKAVSKKLLKLAKKQINDEQKPVEWSKDDEQYLLICKNALSKYQVSDKWDAGIISRWLEERLKSLRPQTTWKPSDEQMNALDSTLQYSQVSHNSFEHLNSLFNDLKNLKS